MRRSFVPMLFFVLFASVTSGQVNQLNVPTGAYPTIQSALNAAGNGDVIQVAAGTYVENLVWPPVQVNVIGAGPGLSILDGNQNGSCILIQEGLASGSMFEGFTITNGSGSQAYNGSPLGSLAYGGAVHIRNMSSASFSFVTFQNCHITGNAAEDGSAVFMRAGGGKFVDCDFDNNVITPLPASAAQYSASFQTAILSQAQSFHNVTFERCQFKQQGDSRIMYFDSGWNPTVLLRECLFFQNNVSGGLVDASTGSVTMELCRFEQNTCLNLVRLWQHGGVYGRVRSCVFAKNILPTGAILYVDTNNLAGNTFEISNCTMVSNIVSNVGKVVATLGPAAVHDCVIQNNVDSAGIPLTSPFFVIPSFGSLTVTNSNVQGQAGLGPNVVDTAPMFVDAASGDYRLKPGSPMVDAGVVNPAFPRSATDIRGRPRVQGLAADMGAYETPALAHHPAAASRVGENSGGPFDVLTMNGSNGGLFRRIEVPIGSSNSLEMAQPPYLSGAVQFAVYGILGEANFSSVINVPLGIGDMMFAPAPMIPYLHPSFFMLVSTFGPIGPWQPLFSATPTPWSSGPGPAIPFPFLMTIQGIIEEGPGVYVPTNALIFEVK